MANRKITSLVALAAPATDDVLPIIDISETGNDLKNKKITYGELFKSLPDGTASAPSVAFNSATSTGLYRSAANELSIATNGGQAIKVEADNKTTIYGDLVVTGSQTTVSSTTITVADKNIELGTGNSSDSGADGGGLTLKGASDKTWNWVDSTDAWTANQHIDVTTGKVFKIAGTQVLSATTLGTGIVNSSLTSVGTLGSLTVTNAVTAGSLDISGGADIDGTLEADAYTVNGTALNEYIADTVGAMVSSNTETNITVTYQDADNTLDFVIGTLNQDTTGNAATATALETARTIGGVSFNGTANINLPGVNQTGNQNTTGSAATLTTARTIGGVSFDGSANIDLPGVNAAGNQNTSGTAAGLSGTPNITVGVVTGGSLDISGSADIDGTLEADAITVDGTALNEYIADTVGAMVSSNTETNIAVTYDDTDNTLDFSVVNITGNAATATALQTARTINGVSFDGTGNITVTSAAGTLSGTTLNSSVVTSSLTSVGTLGSLAVTNAITAGSLDIAGGVDVDGTLEADAITVDGTALNEFIADTVGAMVSSNTETNITVTYQDADNTLDFVIGTLNQDTTGNAATATALQTARTIGGTSFDGTANITPANATTAVNVTGTIGSSTTGTTQSAGDNSTKVATTAYVETAISNLIDSSPGALNTLNELAAAIGDDANFSTTITNSIATKLSLAGGTMTGAIDLGSNNITNGGTITGTFVGNVTGNITGNTSGSSGSCTGNAATATKLATARTIGGTSFDGSANIAVALAATATALATARTIGGVSFDGTGNINLPGVNAAGNQNTSGTSAGLTGTPNITVGVVTAGSLDISGNVDVDGTLETDALTIDGVSLAETIADTVGAMVGSNTETGITVTYNDSDNTLDFVVGTLNQSTTGNAATATALATARTINGVSFDGTGNITVTAAAGTLTGNTLASGVTASSLTSVGTLTGLTVSGNISMTGTGAIDVPTGTTGQRPGSPTTGLFRYNSTEGEFEGYTASGWGAIAGGGGASDFKYLALRNAANNGAASYPASDFTLVTSGTTNAITPTAANVLLVSVGGVIQQPNTGTSTPTTGFAISGSTIKFGSNISAAPDFIIYQQGGGIGTPSDNTVTSAKIVDGAIVNADINASAAIAGTKISPDFGSQNIVTTGSLGVGGYEAIDTGTPYTYYYGKGGTQAGGLSVQAKESAIEVVSSEDSTHGGSLIIRTTSDGAGFVYNSSTNALELKTFTPTADHFTIHSTGGNISSLITQLRVVKDAQVELAHNGTVKLSTSSSGVDITGTTTSSYLTLSAVNPNITFTDTNENPDFRITVNGGELYIEDLTNSATRFKIKSDGQVDVTGNLDVAGQLILDYSSAYPLNINNSNDGKIVLQGSNNPYIYFREGSSDKCYLQWATNGTFTIYNNERSKGLILGDTLTWDGGTVWHSGNDGSGSGLDADTIDGIGSTQFLRSDADDTASGKLTLTDHLTLEDTYLRVGDISNDNWLRLTQATADGYGFDWQHDNAAVMVNEQGTTNQALVLGDVDASDDYEGLFGIAHSGDAGGSWTKKLNLFGNGDLFVGPSAEHRVWNSGNFAGRNLLINGAMTINQKNASSSSDGYQVADMWWWGKIGMDQAVTTQANVTNDHPDGFDHSFKLTVGTAESSLDTNEWATLRTRIEGQNLQHLKTGTASAEQITLSFWAKTGSANTGDQYSVTIIEGDISGNDRIQKRSFTATSTWQRFTMTYVGQTNNAIRNDNDYGITIYFVLVAASNKLSAADTTWELNTASKIAVTGQSNFFDNTSNEFYITGVQLEVGSVASPFEHRSHGEELAKCQRYYSIFHPTGQEQVYIESGGTSTHSFVNFPIPPGMRSEPSVSLDGTWTGGGLVGGRTITNAAVQTVDNGGLNGTTHPGSMGRVSVRITRSGSSYTSGQIAHTDAWDDGAAWLSYSSEL